MTKILNGRDLADFIKERQARQVRGLIQHDHIRPKLAIIQTIDHPVIDTYVRLKKAYGADILIEVDVYKIEQSTALELIARLNQDDSVYGIIIQLPLENSEQTQELVDAVTPEKDVDGLGRRATMDPATPVAINWLLAGYNIELRGKNIVIVGNGRLVGAPLARMWRNSNLTTTVLDSGSHNPAKIRNADVIVAATGVPNLIKRQDVKVGAVVVDAGTASEQGKIVGDVDPALRERSDIVITPEKGGVGPLTITALFDNVIRAARAAVEVS